MNKDGIYISSYQELKDKIEDIKSKLEQFKCVDSKNEKIFFRGQANKEWNLIPNILRGNCSELEQINETNESFDTNDANRLAIAQHYGKKTRCLDFTRNINVALYFACKPDDNIKNDGAIYCVLAYGHRPSWFTNYLVNYISSSTETIISANDLSIKLLQNENIVSEFERTGRLTEINNVNDEVQIYLGKGFMVDFEGENDLFEKYPRILKQDGALFYFGSKYFYYDDISGKEINVPIESLDYCYGNWKYSIKLHEINESSLVGFEIYKIIIPQHLKKEIFDDINISAKDLGFED